MYPYYIVVILFPHLLVCNNFRLYSMSVVSSNGILKVDASVAELSMLVFN